MTSLSGELNQHALFVSSTLAQSPVVTHCDFLCPTGKIFCMEDPEEDLEKVIQVLQSSIGTMTETQVLSSLRMVEALRRHEREMLGRLKSVSLASTEDSTGEINQLEADLNLYRRPSVVLPFWDYFEEALKRRLETLRKGPNSNS
jgi:hypothetical protein